MKPTRRNLMTGGVALAASLVSPRLRAEPMLSDDGLYRQPWFVESFLELGDDLQSAGKSGKRFAIMWELRGCPYCRETHLVNFARRDIEDYVKANFDILQLNIIGARKVTDFDGSEISEKALAAKYGVRFTPTIQFFPVSVDSLSKALPDARGRVSAAGRFPRDVPLRAREGIRTEEFPGLCEGDALVTLSSRGPSAAR
jgi:hypothetical protein